MSLALFLGVGSVVAQEGMQAANTQTIVMEVVPEPGCPVEITGGRTELGFDSFGLPVFGKTYIDYKNAGEKAINAVKFRVRYLDKAGASRGTFHANDEAFVPQGATASGKFAHYKLRSNIQQAKIRVLAIKFSDGSTWESVRMKEIHKAQQEGRDVDADDEALDKQTSNPPVAPAAQPAPPAAKPVTATPAPAVEPVTSAPAQPPTAPAAEPLTAAPAQPVSAPAAEPLTATPAQPSAPAISAPQEAAPPPASQPASEPAKSAQPVEEEPLSATPQALPLKKGSDPFSSQ